MKALTVMTNLPALLTLVSLAGLTGCGKQDSTELSNAASPPPPGSYRVEAMINDYEKISDEYVRVTRKLKKGDVSIAVRCLELEERTKQESAQLQQASAQMTPEQAKRVAAISARTAPYRQD